MQVSQSKPFFQISCLSLAASATQVRADDARPANEFNEPVASLISIRMQCQYDLRFGMIHDGRRQLINVQPDIHVSLKQQMSLISWTIMPVLSRDELSPVAGDQVEPDAAPPDKK